MIKTSTRIRITAVLAFIYVCSAQAKLIAHYDFSDGDLLDNEVGADYTLRAMKPVDASLEKVSFFARQNGNV